VAKVLEFEESFSLIVVSMRWKDGGGKLVQLQLAICVLILLHLNQLEVGTSAHSNAFATHSANIDPQKAIFALE
jgi:hypothetical protein